MVAGDVVNTARARPVGRRARSGLWTRRPARDRGRDRLRGAGTHELKGKAEPIAAGAVRVVAESPRRRRVDGLEAPFVGRDRELR